MVRTVRRTAASLSPTMLSHKMRKWALLKKESTDTTKEQNKIRDELMAHAEKFGEPDEKGNLIVELPEFEAADGSSIVGFQRTRRVSQIFNEEAALALAKKKKVEDRVIVQVPTIDQDAFYVLNQEGVITDKEMDALIEEKVTWAFNPARG